MFMGNKRYGLCGYSQMGNFPSRKAVDVSVAPGLRLPAAELFASLYLDASIERDYHREQVRMARILLGRVLTSAPDSTLCADLKAFMLKPFTLEEYRDREMTRVLERGCAQLAADLAADSRRHARKPVDAGKRKGGNS